MQRKRKKSGIKKEIRENIHNKAQIRSVRESVYRAQKKKIVGYYLPFFFTLNLPSVRSITCLTVVIEFITQPLYLNSSTGRKFRKRTDIEPVIGHCKSDHRLGRNYCKGLFGDSINVMLAAAAFNFKRATRALLCLFQELLSGWIKPFLRLKNFYFWQVPSCYADMRTRDLAF